ncbi:hypothetical protein A1A1_09676 [Planococcus antarcticus DSM 14505]|uniref:Transposase n=1 Tax=Planococcus antarcticus DSM 14505 TaxID=1185653 RepID=A0A1C7DGN1_9BACL|nr:hypothetical protein [Planococcus antarcticus]ANU10719.1 hypothetical protein BBH88_10560 [Planococcus antarcticus DSM 14505]EIM06809.1 hypothetical protein A1A1_09676 [Planococcus antarcticus DSM 14505]
MKYKHFKSTIEHKYKTSLKELLYTVCVVEKLNALKGSKQLGIAKEVFVYWRHYYRFEERQRLFDQTVKEIKDKPVFYAEEVKNVIECHNSNN